MSAKMETTPSTPNPYHLRLATLSDIPQIRFLIDASVRGLHASYYTPAQISRALETVYGVDTQLINDGHYFVVEALNTPSTDSSHPNPSIIASGGWSHRMTLYGGDQHTSRDDNLLDPEKDAAKIRAFFVHPVWTRKGIAGLLLRACEEAAREAGFSKAEMGSTLSGVPFYTRMGYREVPGDARVKQPLGGGEVLEIVKMGKVLP